MGWGEEDREAVRCSASHPQWVYRVKLCLVCHTVAIKWVREKAFKSMDSVFQESLNFRFHEVTFSLVNSSLLLSNLSFDLSLPLIEARTHPALCRRLYHPHSPSCLFPRRTFVLSPKGKDHAAVSDPVLPWASASGSFASCPLNLQPPSHQLLPCSSQDFFFHPTPPCFPSSLPLL